MRLLTHTNQLYWLLMLLFWGSVRLSHARSDLPKGHGTDMNEDDHWSSGQILSALLLIAPVWSAIVGFTENKSQTIIDHVRLNNLLQEESDAPHNEADPRLVVPVPAESVTHDTTSLNFITRDFYQTAPWFIACLFMACATISLCTTFQFLYVLTDAPRMFLPNVGVLTLKEFWITQLGILYVLVFAYPLAHHSTILYGLWMDDWLRGLHLAGPMEWRRYAVWLLSLLIWGCYIVAWWMFVSTSQADLIGVYFWLWGILTLIYLLGNLRAAKDKVVRETPIWQTQSPDQAPPRLPTP